MVKTPYTLSYSACNLYEQCAHRFHQERVLKKRKTKTVIDAIPMILGNFIHEVCDRYLKHLVKENRESDYEKCEEIANDLWENRDENGEWRLLPEIMREEMLEVVERMREGLHVDPDQEIGSELDLAFTRDWKRTKWNAKDVFFRAKIDRLYMNDSRAHVWDLKTGRSIDDVEDTMQLPTYVFLVSLVQPEIEKYKVQLFYPRINGLREKEYEKDVGLKALKWIESIAKRVDRSIKKNDWPATPGLACNGCPAFADCPERETAVTLMAPESHQQATKLFERWVILDQERADIIKRLKPYVDDNGPLEANGLVIKFGKKEKISFNTHELYKILEDSGLDPKKFFKGDNTEIKKLAKKDAGIKPQIEKIMKVKPYTEFKYVKNHSE